MLEQQQEVVSALLKKNNNFKRLYDKYALLKSEVNHANDGDLAMDDLALEQLKKEKLLLKDRLVGMIEDYPISP